MLVWKTPFVLADSMNICSEVIFLYVLIECMAGWLYWCLVLQVSLPLRRDGTDGQAEVFWSLQPIGDNIVAVTVNDLGPLSGSVVFLSGQSDASINFTIMADNIPEVNETLLLTLDRYGNNIQEKLLLTNIIIYLFY